MVTNISYYNDNSLSIVILNTIMLVVATWTSTQNISHDNDIGSAANTYKT
jgi:hypothetical protein